ncbi:MAG: hypothetical protein Ct9H300mP16_17860 [Pseudomonadota bacterium]|nr:MAG: hypothetical protein Ct9H300mP16_17860 [Pseudomonadota bacterium]
MIPIPDEEAGEIPKGVVVLKDPEAPSDEMAESIMAFVADRVAPHKRVRSLDFIDQIPKSASGKIFGGSWWIRSVAAAVNLEKRLQ